MLSTLKIWVQNWKPVKGYFFYILMSLALKNRPTKWTPDCKYSLVFSGLGASCKLSLWLMKWFLQEYKLLLSDFYIVGKCVCIVSFISYFSQLIQSQAFLQLFGIQNKRLPVSVYKLAYILANSMMTFVFMHWLFLRNLFSGFVTLN